MNCIRLLSRNPSILNYVKKSIWDLQSVRFRRRSPCDVCLCSQTKKPCFDIRNVTIVYGSNIHGKAVRSFLYNHYWPREPSVVALWMNIDCSYLDVLSDKYAYSGDRLLAYEYLPRTKEHKLIGLTIANKTYPWVVKELEEWAHYTYSQPERNRMYFIAHCIRSPSLFQKYKVDYIYNIEILGTASEVTGQGVGTILLKKALNDAEELRHPLVQVIAVSKYAARICEKAGMKQEWTMKYSDFIDDAGTRVFFPRRPHQDVSVYIKYFDPKLGARIPCLPPF